MLAPASHGIPVVCVTGHGSAGAMLRAMTLLTSTIDTAVAGLIRDVTLLCNPNLACSYCRHTGTTTC